MGFGGISIWQLLIILVIVVLLFGTKKLKSLGTDLGGAIKGFKNALSDEEKKDKESNEAQKRSIEDEDTESSPQDSEKPH